MFVYSYLNHYYDLKRFKIAFINQCPVQYKYEAYKIWAYWIIFHRSFRSQIDFFLPSQKIEGDQQIIRHLIQKGATSEQARDFYAKMTTEAFNLVKCHYHLFLLHNPEKTAPTIVSDTEASSSKSNNNKALHVSQQPLTPQIYYQKTAVALTYQSIKHQIRTQQYQKLIEFYQGTESEFTICLWKMLNNYYLLDGHSYQWAIPVKILKLIHNVLGVQTELFASPINAYYERFYSLFEEDRMFGSLGNFFNAPASDFLEGAFQVNPPFIDSVFVKTIERLLSFLDRAEKHDKPLLFLFFMPNWLDSEAYQTAKEHQFCRGEMVLPKRQHFYFSYKDSKYVRVQFDTHLLVLASSRSKDLFSPQLQQHIRGLFSTEGGQHVPQNTLA